MHNELKIQPVNDFVVLERDKEDEATKSGIIIKHDHENKAYHGVVGTVIALDPSTIHDDGVVVGGKVLYNKYDALPSYVKGEEYECVSYSQLYARVVV